MTSTLFIVRGEDALVGELPDTRVAAFAVPIKSVFGRRLCDTDGSIGYPTWVQPAQALEIVAEAERLSNLNGHERAELAKVRKWAEAGHELFADWVH